MKNNQFETLSQAVNALAQEGFTAQFTINEANELQNIQSGQTYKREQFEIESFHRFEGMSNPSDMSIVYAIKTTDQTKGTLTGAYGAYADLLEK